jgi:UDP-glucose 4-epimerase
MAKVLVVGGAGYVGSTTCAWLLDAGHQVWVLDDLSTGLPELVLGNGFLRAQAGNCSLVSDCVSKNKFDCVFHFAAWSLVSESLKKSREYFQNNVAQTQRLLETLLDHGIRNLVFSSSCAIFGDPGNVSIGETLPMKPLSPYGETKVAAENLIRELTQTKGLRAISLRYFNAAGAEPQLRVGECHQPETHLIPRLMKAALHGNPIEIFGTDYPTKDGTCIRDYVHVWELAAAHVSAMDRILGFKAGPQGFFEAYNLGSEKGYSVREVIQACERVVGEKFQTIEKSRRPGDATRLVANSQLARQILGFGKKNLGLDFDLGLESMLSSAWEWEKKWTKTLKKAVFLDRDGTLNVDPGYLNHPDQLHLIPGVGEALSLLKKAGFLLVVVSNQSGVGRGLIEEKVLTEIHKKLDELLGAWSVQIDYYSLCFHHPEEDCECRKPKPKLLYDAAKQLRIDLGFSYMVGDKASDVNAGYAAGCKGSLLIQASGKPVPELYGVNPAFTGESLLAIAHWILKVSTISLD